MTPERRAEIRALADGATEGWVLDPADVRFDQTIHRVLNTHGRLLRMEDTGYTPVHSWDQRLADAEFIAASRQAVPELLDDIERLEGRIAELEEGITQHEDDVRGAWAIYDPEDPDDLVARLRALADSLDVEVDNELAQMGYAVQMLPHAQRNLREAASTIEEQAAALERLRAGVPEGMRESPSLKAPPFRMPSDGQHDGSAGAPSAGADWHTEAVDWLRADCSFVGIEVNHGPDDILMSQECAERIVSGVAALVPRPTLPSREAVIEAINGVREDVGGPVTLVSSYKAATAIVALLRESGWLDPDSEATDDE